MDVPSLTPFKEKLRLAQSFGSNHHAVQAAIDSSKEWNDTVAEDFLNRYLELARLPTYRGTPALVMKALMTTLGEESPELPKIAKQLDYKTRTLQRRLKERGTTFYEIRDKIRLHFSVDMLLRSDHTVEYISEYFGYNNRTGFTNAFRRWTGLTPAVFRKLFRDYC